jgi:hypothetical protein
VSAFKDLLGNTVRAGDLVRLQLRDNNATARVAEISGGLAGPDGKIMPLVVSFVVPVPMTLDPQNPFAPVYKLAEPQNEAITEALLESSRRAS